MPNPLNPTVLLVDLGGIDPTAHTLTLLAASAARKEATIRNDTDKDIPYAEGYTPTANLYTDVIPAGGRLVLGRNAAPIIGYFADTPTGKVMTTELI